MRWKRYRAYRESGVEWLDAIPASWGVKPLKRVASLNDDSLSDNTDGQFRMLYVDISSVDEGQGILRKQELAFEDAPSRARRLVRHGDVIISTVRTYLRAIAPVVNPEDNLVVSTGFAVVRPVDGKLESSFAAYALRSQPFIESIMRFSVGVSYPAINPSTLGDLPLVLPSREEQHRIATFLDHRTSYIDTLISKKQRQLQLLEEKRIALIAHAVTKGLDPNVKMKDSGVAWLGKVPEHWAVTCLGRFARVKSGEFISNQETSGEKQPPHVYPVIGGNGIMGYCADYNEEGPLIVVGRVGAQCGNVHLLDERVWVTDNALILHDMRGFWLEYLTYFLQVAQLNQYASQTAQPLITGSMLKAHSVILPPVEEQRSIASFLDRQTAHIDALRDKIRQSIDTLQEYRFALISAAVTGQIDVRGGSMTMAGQYTETAFEAAIEEHLLAHGGYQKRTTGTFDPELCLDTELFLRFIQTTQPKEWQYLVDLRKDKAGETLLDDLCRALDSEHEGCLKVLRHGFKCFGKTFRAAYFAPASGLNPETQRLYDANILTVTRQLRYAKQHTKTLDMILSLNGIPIITAELKNPMTGQTWRDAARQYKHDRDPRDLLFQFGKRTLVHFAVDPDLVYMTTKLDGTNTFFLPFNKGDGTGAGNPVNPNGHRTAYLWEEIWQKDSLMEIIAKYIHLEVGDKQIGGNRVKKKTMIFPRYHQLDAVRALVRDAQAVGVGRNYLIQHSAGSGKSNSIAWLAHQLSSLHDHEDNKVFHSVVVVTDRRVLDQQLQDTIYQFEHKAGVVEKIDQDSMQLANALRSGVPIIITTLQKFPYVTERIGILDTKRYAVIIDEAHSSQGGETATELKGTLGGASLVREARRKAEEEGLADYEEEILLTMAKRGHQENISFFAFTATPKYKTLEVFGEKNEDGVPEPFHLYSMRQAIEEGFILDVLEHYTTYKTYFKLIKSIEDDPKVDKRKASKALARFVSLHPYNIAQKTEVIVEHFNAFTRHKIGGKAKAMVVTSSRLHAVRYKQAFDRYIKDHGYDHIRTLVAFSGTVVDPDNPRVEYTEVQMNGGIREDELRGQFDTDKYHVLIVAEKFQTGFDQPLLHTMYVDKKLSGVHAVQTLSRLNRTYPGKEDTFILDFVNDAEDIQAAFQPYYEKTLVGDRVDYKQLYELQAKLDSYQIFCDAEVEEFCKVFFRPKKTLTKQDHGKLNAIIDPAVQRFRKLDDETQQEFRDAAGAFRRLYAFLAQIIPFQDSDLEKLYTYIRFLLNKLPKRDYGPEYDFNDDVDMRYYRLEKIQEGSIALEPRGDGEVSGPTAVGTGQIRQEEAPLSELIRVLNERFGTRLTEADQLFWESIKEDAVQDPTIQEAAKVNTLENFTYKAKRLVDDLVIDRMDKNNDMVAKYFDNPEFQYLVQQALYRTIYDDIHAQ